MEGLPTPSPDQLHSYYFSTLSAQSGLSQMFCRSNSICRVQLLVASSEITNTSNFHNVTEENFFHFDTTPSNSSTFLYLEPGVYHSITDIVGVKMTFIRERHNHSNFHLVKVSRKTQKIQFDITNGRSGHAFFSTNLGPFLEAMLAMNWDYC